MEALFPLLLMLAIGVIVIVVIISQQRALKKRAEDLNQFADSIGLAYLERADPDLLGELRGFKLFSKGRGQTITNMIRGEAEGVNLAMFDYQYTVGSGKNQQTLRQTVVHIAAGDLAAPEFAIGPENFLHRIGSFFGMQDINFDTNPNFSKLFLLRGPNEKAIRGFFTPERLSFFEKHPTISAEACGDQLVVFQHGIRPTPDKLNDLMGLGFEVYAVLRQSDE